MFTPKKRRVERSNDPEVWLRWFNALSNREEGPVDEDDDEAEDDVSVDVSVAEKSDHETESELEVSEEEELHQEQSDLSRSGNIRSSEGEKREDDLDQARPSNFYIEKNKVTKYSKNVLFSVTSNSFIFVTEFFFIHNHNFKMTFIHFYEPY
jgi:hypothetical protein